MTKTALIDQNENLEVIKTPVGDGVISPLLQAAMSGQFTPEVLSQYLEVQKAYEANEAKKAYHQAVANFKRNPPVVIKDKKNSQFNNSAYVSRSGLVNTVNPALSEHGLSAHWEPDQSQNGLLSITCVLTHELGHSESATMSAPPDKSGSKNPIQELKSTKTYLEIATYEAVTGVAASDHGEDDGNATGKVQDLFAHNMAVKEWLFSIMVIKDGLNNDADIEAAAEAYAEMNRKTLFALNVASTKGGIWTTEEHKQFRENKQFKDTVQIHRKDSGWHNNPENQI
jgi:hypothetical protein